MGRKGRSITDSEPATTENIITFPGSVAGKPAPILFGEQIKAARTAKRMSQEEGITQEAMNVIMSEEKKSDVDKVTIKNDVLKKYFPKSYTPKQMEDTIVKLLDQWQKKRMREQQLQ